MAGEEGERGSASWQESLLASMRPRLGGRGREAVSASKPGEVSRFNEAPARWPGKRQTLFTPSVSAP